MKPLAVLSAASALALCAGLAAGQCSTTKLVATDRAGSDFLGGSLSMSSTNSGPTFLAGMGADDTADGANAGSVRMFLRINSTWGELDQSRLLANDGQPNDFFGVSVGYSDPYAIVGATGVGETGAVYFFERAGSTWTQMTKSFPAGTASGDDLGRSVAVDGAWAIAGAPLHDFDGSPNPGIQNPNAGAAYIYHRNANGTWAVVDTVSNYDEWGSNAGDQLGTAVAISGAVAAIGAPYGQNINWPEDMGYVRVMRRSGLGVWTTDTPWRLYSNNAQQGDHYGAAVATDGDFIAIGAPDDDSTAAQTPDIGAHTDSGCVYIQYYDEGSWHIDGQVFASDGTDGAHFGSSVAIKDGRLVVGARGAKKTYIFRRSVGGPDGAFSWVQDAVIADPDGTAAGAFASAVAYDGQSVIIGDEGDDNGGFTNDGAAYVYTPGGAYSDSCDGAVAVEAGTTYGCTDYATLGSITTCGGGSPGADVWLAWTPHCSGNAIIDTMGSGYDTVLSIHDACPGGGSSHTLVCNDDISVNDRDSLVSFPYTAGTTYRIRVSGYDGAHGDFVLRINAGITPTNDSCATPAAVATGATPFANCLATTAGPTECAGVIYNDLWFRYTAACSGTTLVNTCGADFDTVVAVYLGTGCPSSPGTAIACNDDAQAGSACFGTPASSLSFPTVQGFQYLIRVGGFWNIPGYGTGSGTLNITCQTPCPADYNADGVINVQDFLAFLQGYSVADPHADFNQSGSVNVQDFLAFLQGYSAGC